MDQMMAAQFVHAYPPAESPPGPSLWLPFYRGDLLVHGNSKQCSLHLGSGASVSALNLSPPLYLGTFAGVPCLTAEFESDLDVPEGWTATSLRGLYGQLSEEQYALAGYASQMLHWRRTSVFCPVCGHRTDSREGDWGRLCHECGHVSYPHVTPATLILIHDGPRLLLAHKPGWGTRYSILAGFVEPGESLEECVRREVREEAGIEISDLTYAGSQPWPFPHQLMIGFTACYVGGEIVVDGEELDHADWFTRDALPDLPSPVSLSRKMIDRWVNGT